LWLSKKGEEGGVEKKKGTGKNFYPVALWGERKGREFSAIEMEGRESVRRGEGLILHRCFVEKRKKRGESVVWTGKRKGTTKGKEKQKAHRDYL